MAADQDESPEFFDQQIADLIGPTDPDATFRLGQAAPEAPDVVAAIEGLLMPEWPNHQAIVGLLGLLKSRPGGTRLTQEEIETLQAEQEPVRVMPVKDRNPASTRRAFSGDIALLEQINWHPLEDLEQARAVLRTPKGRTAALPVRTAPLAAFLTAMCHTNPWLVDSPLEGWIDRHVFAQLLGDEVQYVEAYASAGAYPTNQVAPDWVTQATKELPHSGLPPMLPWKMDGRG